MSYVEVGEGAPIVLLHGNPTSSHVWRNVIPHLATLGRVIAPDLIGMGHSDKLEQRGPGVYRFVEHRGFLDHFLRAVDATTDVTFVLHEWGSALGFDWAHRRPASVRGIAYMEAIVRPFSWADVPESSVEFFRSVRTVAGEELVLENNHVVETVLPDGVIRELSEEEMDCYRAPFADVGERRRPTLTWPREFPIDGTPTDVSEIVAAYGTWLESSEVPKLFINAEPGLLLTGAQREYCRRWPNQTEVTVVGRHVVQEDSPAEIGQAIAAWFSALE
jgi:haloalkane dehalogenase